VPRTEEIAFKGAVDPDGISLRSEAVTQSETHSAMVQSTEGSITEAAGDDLPPPSPYPTDNPFDGTHSDPSIVAEVEVIEVSHHLEQTSLNENPTENGEAGPEEQNGEVQVFCWLRSLISGSHLTQLFFSLSFLLHFFFFFYYGAEMSRAFLWCKMLISP